MELCAGGWRAQYVTGLLTRSKTLSCVQFHPIRGIIIPNNSKGKFEKVDEQATQALVYEAIVQPSVMSTVIAYEHAVPMHSDMHLDCMLACKRLG